MRVIFMLLLLVLCCDINHIKAFVPSPSKLFQNSFSNSHVSEYNYPSNRNPILFPDSNSLYYLNHDSYPMISNRNTYDNLLQNSALLASTNGFFPVTPDTKKNEYNVVIEAPSINSRKISASLLIDGTVDDVWSILTDYNNLAQHVPNLVKSYVVPGPPGTTRLFQEGAQKIIGFDFRASVTMDMIEEPVDTNRALQERQLSFKLVDSLMFSNFEGSWNVKYHKRTPSVDPVTKEISYLYTTLLTYTVFVRPKGPVPVIALEWRIKEDIPTNLSGMKIAAEKVAAARRNNSNLRDRTGGGGGKSVKSWGTGETLGLYMVSSRRVNN